MLAKLTAIGRFLLGMMFIYAAFTKLSEPWLTFAMSVDSYQLLPDWGVFMVARWLPWMELVIGLLLVAGVGVRWSGVAASALLGFFLAIMVRSYMKGLNIDCGCFGAGEKLGPGTLVRDSTFVALALFVTISAFWPQRRRLQ